MSSAQPFGLNDDAVQRQVKTIDRSVLFRNVTGQKRLLGFLVKEKLAGHADRLTAASIADALFQGKRNKMRAEFFRLRARLEEYYRTVGESDSVRIEIPLGAYVPEFSCPPGSTITSTESLTPSADRATEARVRFYTAFSTFQMAFEEKRWEKALLTVEEYLSTLDESLLPSLERTRLPAFRLSRFIVLTQLKRFDQVAAALTAVNLQDAFPSELHSAILCFALIAFENVGNQDQAGRIRQKLLELVDVESPDRLAVVKLSIQTARALRERNLYEAALKLADGLAARIDKFTEGEMRTKYAEARYLAAYNLSQLGRSEDALRVREEMERDFACDSNETIVSNLAWATTEATRALRALGRHQEADLLAEEMQERYRGVNEIETRKAVGWAVAERYETCVAAKDFNAAIDRCSRFTTEYSVSGGAPPLLAHLASVEARKVMCMRKAKLYDQAISACDALVEHYGSNEDVEIQQQVAFVLIEKAIALRRLKRLAASTAVAREIAVRFADADDKKILGEVLWSIHAEGDTLLCESKLLLKNGLTEDAALKLQEARRMLNDAATKEPNDPRHLGCKAYAEFLLGERSAAEKTFAKALALAKSDWLDELDNDDWTELSTFSLPEDSEFVMSVHRWSEPHRSTNRTS